MNAIITGATKGIGKAIALKLAQEGYNLAICARTETDLLAFKNELAHYNVKIIAIKADVSNKEEVYNFCTEVKNVYSKIDVLVNNAGIFMPGNLLEEEDKNFEYQSKINLNTPYYLSKYFGKIMRDQQSGHIFNICSIASTEIIDNAGSYSVTKAAILSLNNVLRKELSAYNVKVTAILPGSTFTASWEGTSLNPDKFVQPEDIANSLYSILNLSSGVNVDEIILKPLNFNT
ncbi:SDR family oxidoreductase [Pedobacter sp. UC225_61]|uniref:SDR family oxidoreductase n=1 Tax=Pedobacter sp. UC225_61 TaxID=3374623 RepID=UPI00379D270D